MRPEPVQEDLPVLSASEIANYTFCPQAWYLDRRNVARNAEVAMRLAAGTVAHQQIGARADRVRAIDLAWRLLIVVTLGLAVILAIQLFSAGTLAVPW